MALSLWKLHDTVSAWLCQCFLISWDAFHLMGGLGLHNSSRHKPHIEIFDVISGWDSSSGFLALAHNKPCEIRCVQMLFCKSNENPVHKDTSVWDVSSVLTHLIMNKVIALYS